MSFHRIESRNRDKAAQNRISVAKSDGGYDKCGLQKRFKDIIIT